MDGNKNISNLSQMENYITNINNLHIISSSSKTYKYAACYTAKYNIYIILEYDDV